jgi:two-component system cell cycle sensor histidine kinase/response regulator CckA
VSLSGVDGAILGAVGIVEDITRRQRAEEALRRSEERYRTILQETVEAYYEVDLTGTMTFCNDAMIEVLGYPREEVIGLNNRAYMDEATGKRVFQSYKRVYETGQPIKAVGFEYARKDGARIAVEMSVSLMRDVDGKPVGFRGMVRDVTDRKRLEEQLLQSQKMEVVGTLAGGVAHDFNNLLQAMLSQAQLLRRLSSDEGRTATVVQELEQQIQRGASLTRQLLLFSRRETARPERLDLNDAVREATQILLRLVRANIALVIELAPSRLPVEADRGQLQQVLMNLTLNASDAIPERGQLVIRTGAFGRREVWLSVEDSGRGIPEVIRDRIFEPFFTTKDREKGTGLGLSVVHGIVTRNGGRIEVESTVGRGSTFRVVLPRVESSEASPTDEALAVVPELAIGKGERVLIVEDEAGAREGLREILAMLGYDVAAVGSGEEAERLPGDQPFDLVLTDLMLPGAAGPQVADGLRRRWPALKVILMSGYAEDEAVRRGVATGSVRFLQKPFSMEALTREVRAALDEPREA